MKLNVCKKTRNRYTQSQSHTTQRKTTQPQTDIH